jgi:hypothetical protein
MDQYYDRAKFRRLARECSTQAQTIGVILVGEASFVNCPTFFYHSAILHKLHAVIENKFITNNSVTMTIVQS